MAVLSQVIESAPETKCVELGKGVLDRVPAVFSRFFHGHPALIIADPRTFAVAGHAVLARLRRVTADSDSLIFTDPGFYAENSFVCAIETKLHEWPDTIPVAVGSGTINDVTKLAAHRADRRYMAVATAASMDGYTAFGASITYQGSKQTFACAAPIAVVADTEILQAAPAELTALLAQPLEDLDINACCEQWPAWATVQKTVRDLFGNSDLAAVALRETQAKYVDAAGLRHQLLRLRRVWPELKTRLRQQLMPASELKKRLSAAGAPSEPAQISLSPERRRHSFRLAYFIRRRFTVLDLAARTGLLDAAPESAFNRLIFP